MKKGHRARDGKIGVLCNKCGQASHHVSLCDVRIAQQVPPVAEFLVFAQWGISTFGQRSKDMRLRDVVEVKVRPTDGQKVIPIEA